MYVCGGVIPALAGSRLQLRPMTTRDAPALFHIWSHPQVARWLGAPPLTSVAGTEQLITLLLEMAQEEESLRWSIIGPSGEVIGSCGYNRWQLQGAYRGEVGCDLSPAFWGQGLMREALILALNYGFEVMGLNRIEALCDPDNARMSRLAKSLGFRQEGLLRQYRHTAAGFQDILLHAVLRPDWKYTE